MSEEKKRSTPATPRRRTKQVSDSAAGTNTTPKPPRTRATGTARTPKTATTRARKPRTTPTPAVDAPVTAEQPAAPTAAPVVTAAAPPHTNSAPAPDRLSILMVTPEAHPFAKTGGLAEVAGALPFSLADLGHDVTLVLPRYRGIEVDGARSIGVSVAMGSFDQQATLFVRRLGPRITLVLVDVPELFDRDGLYGDANGDYPDNAWRFAVFSRAALEYARVSGVRPSVIHAHDWQTGLVPVYQKMLMSDDPHVGGVPVVFTIHNLAFQGLFPSSVLPGLGLGWNVFDVQALEYWGQISYLKGGINFSEKITTVSPGYAREIVQPELGFGFDGILARRAGDLVGILNGIDTARWNPSADPLLPVAFDPEELEGKARARALLLERVRLVRQPASRPVVGLISRLTDQKGFDLIAAALPELLSLDAAWVMLGSGERRYEDLWRELAARYPDRVSTTIGFDEELAHLIEAGADLFLMPSRFEPCGLNQLYSLRYGTIPVVRATGGLDDTVIDAEDTRGQPTGFKFRDYSPDALVRAVRRALDAFGRREEWRAMQRAGMREDHSWNASAREYVKVYGSLQRIPTGE